MHFILGSGGGGADLHVGGAGGGGDFGGKVGSSSAFNPTMKINEKVIL